jgi:hypothetical protein
MVHGAVSIHPQNAEKLQDVGRLLRRGRARLTGSKGENLTIPEPLYSLLKDAVRNLTQGRSLVITKGSALEIPWRSFTVGV